MATVTYDHVTKSFGDFTAVKDLNLQVRDEEFLVLVGPSGCGKTTALRMLAGLEEQSTGDIFIGERRVNDVAPKDRDIAMVFQNYALYPHMSVYDNIAGAQQNGHLPVEARVEVVEFLGNELQLQLSADGQTFVARVSPNTHTRPGEMLRVGFNLKKLHVFDKATEAALR